VPAQFFRQKRLSYRDQSGSPQSVHQEHWRDFTWEAGPVIVKYVGPWGQLQVWAASEVEGRRVIGHACSVANIPATGQDPGEWFVYTAKPGRNGQGGSYVTAAIDGHPMVTKRIGPSGPIMI